MSAGRLNAEGKDGDIKVAVYWQDISYPAIIFEKENGIMPL